jgi:hypothetical protein
MSSQIVLTPAQEAFLDEIMVLCGFALGSGARMPIKRLAITGLRARVRHDFGQALFRQPASTLEPGPGAPRWDGVPADPNQKPPVPAVPGYGHFVLTCCEAVGRLAAVNAVNRGGHAIEIVDLKPAYNKVASEMTIISSGGAPGGGGSPQGAGEWCPTW